jgi:hypothetical protein
MIGATKFPFSIEKESLKSFHERFNSILRFDEVRIMKLLEIFQYSIIYFFCGFLLGTTLDTLFPKFEETKDISIVVVEVISQLVSFAILIYYMRKIVKLIPFFFIINWDLNGDGKVGKYRPYTTNEYEGEFTIGIVVVASQLTLLKKIDMLCRELESQVMGIERRASIIP